MFQKSNKSLNVPPFKSFKLSLSFVFGQRGLKKSQDLTSSLKINDGGHEITYAILFAQLTNRLQSVGCANMPLSVGHSTLS